MHKAVSIVRPAKKLRRSSQFIAVGAHQPNVDARPTGPNDDPVTRRLVNAAAAEPVLALFVLVLLVLAAGFLAVGTAALL